MSFEITFLGTSGGPLDCGNCSILIKSAKISYADIVKNGQKCLVAIDAGSGHSAITDLIYDSRGMPKRQLAMYSDSLRVQEYSSLPLTWPLMTLRHSDRASSPLLLSHQVFRCISTVLLSHPHMDHISALIINSPLFGTNNPGPCVQVLGLDFTISSLKKHIFNGIIWPDLPSLKLFDLVRMPELKPTSIVDGAYTVTTFEVIHGHISRGGRNEGLYKSSAFLISENSSQNKLLVFGDFESDTSSQEPKNAVVWRHVAPYVLDQTLRGIVLECSTSIVDPSIELYGHLTPTHVIDELQNLEQLCVASRPTPLKGLEIIVTHVKDVVTGIDPRQKVLKELRSLSDAKGLFLSFSIALDGVSMVI